MRGHSRCEAAAWRRGSATRQSPAASSGSHPGGQHDVRARDQRQRLGALDHGRRVDHDHPGDVPQIADDALEPRAENGVSGRALLLGATQVSSSPVSGMDVAVPSSRAAGSPARRQAGAQVGADKDRGYPRRQTWGQRERARRSCPRRSGRSLTGVYPYRTALAPSAAEAGST